MGDRFMNKNKKMAFHKPTAHNYTQYNCRIKDELLEKIREISSKEDISINEVINQCLSFAIGNYEEDENIKK